MGTSNHGSAVSRFIVHRHRTGKTHFDLRIVTGRIARSWSLLKEPPCEPGVRRLAVERESHAAETLDASRFEEEAFGSGKVSTWDEGTVLILVAGPELVSLRFAGKKLSGSYELRRTDWYPGNRWLISKTPTGAKNPPRLRGRSAPKGLP
jgi:DNA ligase D-like protein (predicted 3'-phosphoesterase)